VAGGAEIAFAHRDGEELGVARVEAVAGVAGDLVVGEADAMVEGGEGAEGAFAAGGGGGGGVADADGVVLACDGGGFAGGGEDVAEAVGGECAVVAGEAVADAVVFGEGI